VRSNSVNGTNKGLFRWSAYVTQEERSKLDQEVEVVSKELRLRKPNNSALIGRITEADLRFDRASVARYEKTHSKRPTPARPSTARK